MITLGSRVRDIETSYKGKVTARAEYLHDSARVLVENVDGTGRPIEHWIVEDRVEVIVEAKE